MLDGDQSYTQGIPYTKVDETGVSATYMVAYPGNIQEDAFAWMVFAPSQTTPNVEELYTSGQFTPHSGKQYLMAATATDPATTSTTSDDWLISPYSRAKHRNCSSSSKSVVMGRKFRDICVDQ